MQYSTTINPESEYGITAARLAHNAAISPAEVDLSPEIPATEESPLVPAVRGPNPLLIANDSDYLDYVLQAAVTSWCTQYAPVVVTPPPVVVINGVPQSVTRRQARLALLNAGLLTAVEAWIAQASPAVQIDWECAQEIQRDWPAIAEAATALGLTDAQLDDLFAAAGTL